MSTSPQHGSTLIPSMRYKDAHAAIEWLERVFGFTRHAVYPGESNTVEHAELRHGSGMIMIGSVKAAGAENYAAPSDIGGRVTSPLYLIVPDCLPLWEAAGAAGAEVILELQMMSYGGQAFSVRDPEGYIWSVGEYDPWTALEPTTGAQAASNGA